MWIDNQHYSIQVKIVNEASEIPALAPRRKFEKFNNNIDCDPLISTVSFKKLYSFYFFQTSGAKGAPPYYMSSTTLPRGGPLLRAYSPAIGGPIPADRLKTLPAGRQVFANKLMCSLI